MQLHQLSGNKKKRVQRIGRGGKRGTTSGRGTKGQRSRSGRRIRPAFRDLVIRIPKRRGFRNKPKTDLGVVINLMRLANRLKGMGEKGKVRVNPSILKTLSMVPMKFNGTIKILGKGEVPMAIEVQGLKTSAGAKAAIEKAGGKVS